MSHKYFAEFETDRFIRENFFSDFSYKGTMVEVGAGPTEFYSMSKHFRDTGWRCICIEPNPKFVEMHRTIGNEIYQYACSYEDGRSTFKIVNSGWESEYDGISYSAIDIKYDGQYKFEEVEVEVIKLDTLLSEINVVNVDFLSIDVEGWEIEVLNGFTIEKYNPMIILLENYEHNSGYTDYMLERGYELSKKIEYNYIYKKIK